MSLDLTPVDPNNFNVVDELNKSLNNDNILQNENQDLIDQIAQLESIIDNILIVIDPSGNIFDPSGNLI